MKATTFLPLALGCLFGFSSCQEFLQEDPRAIVTPTNFFNSESDARQSLTGTYAILKNNSLYGQLGLDTYYESGADILEPNRGFGVVEPIANYTLTEASADQSIQLMGVLNTWEGPLQDCTKRKYPTRRPKRQHDDTSRNEGRAKPPRPSSYAH